MRWLINLVLFLTPFVVYFSYARWANARRAATGRDPLLPPWYWLVALGLVFGIAGFFIMRTFENRHTGTYIPASVGADGKIIPGHYEGDDQPAHVPSASAATRTSASASDAMSELHIRQTWLSAPETLRVLDAIEAGGGEARFVGGSVRNALLGEPVADIDIATDVTPDEVDRRLRAAGIASHPTGIAHGTITAVANHKPFEITTLRRDVTTDGRRATVAFTTDWAEDARRRDFTINALYATRDGSVIDLIGGADDIKARRIRFVGNAEDRIREDFLRILRFFRFHAWYGRGEMDRAGLAACAALKEGIASLSGERIHAELLKLLAAPDPVPALRQMAAAGILGWILPGELDFARLAKLVDIEATHLFTDGDALLRLGALLSGGPEQRRHDLANRLRFANAERDRLKAMDRRDVKIVSYLSIREVRRALYKLSPAVFKDLVMLHWAADPKANNAPQWRALLALADSWQRPEMGLTGHDVRAAGVPDGPEIGRVLADVEEWWIDADFTDDKFSLIERLKAVVQATVR